MLSKDLCLLLKESQSISLYSDPQSDNLKPPKSVYFLRFSKNYHHQYDHFSLLDSGFFHMLVRNLQDSHSLTFLCKQESGKNAFLKMKTVIFS